MEKPRDDLQGWHTQCLAHHLPGAQNTDHLVTPVVSQEAIIWNNTHVELELRKSNSVELFCNVSNFGYFCYHPQEGGHYKQMFFDVLHQKYFVLLHHEYTSTDNVCANSKSDAGKQKFRIASASEKVFARFSGHFFAYSSLSKISVFGWRRCEMWPWHKPPPTYFSRYKQAQSDTDST